MQLSEWNCCSWCDLDPGLECTSPLMLSWVPPCHKAANAVLRHGSDGALWTTTPIPINSSLWRGSSLLQLAIQGTQICHLKWLSVEGSEEAISSPLKAASSTPSLSSLLPPQLLLLWLPFMSPPPSNSWTAHSSLLFGLFLLESESDVRAGREGLDVIWPNCAIFS